MGKSDFFHFPPLGNWLALEIVIPGMNADYSGFLFFVVFQKEPGEIIGEIERQKREFTIGQKSDGQAIVGSCIALFQK